MQDSRHQALELVNKAIAFFKTNIDPSINTSASPLFKTVPLSEIDGSESSPIIWNTREPLSKEQVIDDIVNNIDIFNFLDFQLIGVHSNALQILIILSSSAKHSSVDIHYAYPIELSPIGLLKEQAGDNERLFSHYLERRMSLID